MVSIYINNLFNNECTKGIYRLKINLIDKV